MEPFPPETNTTDAENSPADEPRLLTRSADAEAPATPRRTVSLRERFAELNSRLRRRQKLRTHRLHVFTLVLLALLVVALCVVGIATLWLRHAMQAGLPQIDGTLHVAGLHASVQVTRDVQGVPTLRATSLEDLLFAQGFVTAQDRLWQMDALRRHAAGELAEILGSSLVDHDRQQRVLQLREAAENAVATMPEDQRQQLEAYARGVNAFMTQNAGHLPLEFHLLHYDPQPWAPRDSVLVLLVMWQDLSMEFPQKLDREALSAHLPASLLNDLYPVGSWRDRPPTQPVTDLAAPKDEVEQIPLDSTQSALHASVLPFASAKDLLHAGDLLEGHRCDECRAGSNNWAVSAERSASGAPLVSNDMHLGLSMPDIWYEAGLHVGSGSSATLDVAGFTLPGIPFVVAGRNAHVAWSFTNLGGDVQDLRVEHLRGKGADTEFQQADGSWTPVRHHAEHIRVRAGHDVKLDVLTTTHRVGTRTMATPILSPLYPSEKRTLSLAWAIYDPAALHPRFLAVDSANSGTALVAAFSDFGGPSLNVIYGDDGHHIGYHAVGWIPVRGSMARQARAVTMTMSQQFAQPTSGAMPEGEEEEGADEGQISTSTVGAAPAQAGLGYTVGSALAPGPVDALDAGQQWVGYIPYAELPAIVDPASGVLATANARITPNDYPYAVTNDWVDPYRVERIYRLLEGKTGLTPAAMLAVEKDEHSAFDLFLAQRFAYAVDHASAKALGADAKELKAAADLLRDWKGDVSADATPPAIIAAVRRPIWFALLVPQIRAHDKLTKDAPALALTELYTWEESNTALENLLNHQPARWLPVGFANWSDFLATVLARSLKAAHAPADLSRWKYGAVHPVEIAHPVLKAYPELDHLLGVTTGSGMHPSGGDGTTINAVRLHFGPSERFTADLADSEATTANITTGESGNPASAWYLDQFAPWLSGTTFALPLERPQVAHTLTLEP